jgi:hypothetical protein
VVNGQVAGVAGHFLTRRGAVRQVRRQGTEIDLTRPDVEGFRVVPRSSRQSDDWGLRLDVVNLRSSTDDSNELTGDYIANGDSASTPSATPASSTTASSTTSTSTTS